MASADYDFSSETSMWRRTPGLAKAILVFQLGLIVYMASWIFLEYQNNQYLQAYVQTSLNTNIPTLQTALPIFLATGTITVYARLLTRRKGFAEKHSQEEFEAKPLEISAPIIPHDEVIGRNPVRDPLPQLKAILVSNKRGMTKVRRRTIRSGIDGRSRKRTRRPDPIGP